MEIAEQRAFARPYRLADGHGPKAHTQCLRRQPGRTHRGFSLPARARPVRRRPRSRRSSARGDPAQLGRARAHPRHRYRRPPARAPASTPSSPRPTSAPSIPRIPLRQESSPAFEPFEQPVIAHGKVRYVGEPIAVVLAESAGAAEDALDAITLDIESLPAVVDSAAARSERHPVVRGRAAATSRSRSAACAAMPTPLSTARPYVRRERFTVQRHGAVPMEPRGLLAEWDAAGGQLTVSRRRQGRVPQPARAGEADRACRKAPSAWWRTTSAAASARAANSIRRTS